jgi:two-component sensor histidine kinase
MSLPISAAIPCGLIVNELISNALKHGFPDGRSGAIAVSAVSKAGHIVLIVRDDGVGVPEGFDLAHSPTLGLQLVWLLTDQLGATIELNHANPTQFQLRFAVTP